MNDVGIGIGIDDGFGATPTEFVPKYTSATVDSIFKATFNSGIGLDISKNHTGVCMWRDNQVFVSGFKIDYEYDDTDYMAEAKMRMEFKSKLWSLLKDYEWEYCIIEDVYGGTNFDTTRKLLALNCVLDELVLEGNLKIQHIYRFKEPEWLKYAKMTSTVDGRLDSKLITQRILENLNYGFYLTNKDLKDAEKERIFFEDVCDATAQLVGLAICIQKQITPSAKKKKKVSFSSITFEYMTSEDGIAESDNKAINNKYAGYRHLAYTGGSIQQFMVNAVDQYPTEILISEISMNEIGSFAMKHDIPLYYDGILVFCSKSLKNYKGKQEE